MINNTDYVLTSKNYYKDDLNKKMIILANTNSTGMKHFNGWLNRYNGNFKRVAHYTILKNGQIYEHYNPLYSSDFMSKPNIDDKSIIIILENLGYLTKDYEKDLNVDWVGNIYNSDNDVFYRKWRGFDMWDMYTQNQLESAVYLTSKLCNDFNIEKNVISHNTKITNPSEFNGVLYKSNFEKYYLDLNPSWNFEEFKYKVENKND